jgi:hypothetical protein
MRRKNVTRVSDEFHLSKTAAIAGSLVAVAFIASVAGLSAQATTVLKVQPSQYAAAVAKPIPAGTNRHFTIKITNDKVTSGLPINVNQGDHVVVDFKIGMQEEADFQIVGYLQSTTVEKGSKPRFEFDADKAGTYTVQLVRREPWEGEVMKKPVGYLYVH